MDLVVIEWLVDEIISSDLDDMSKDDLIVMKRALAKENNLSNLPTNMQILKVYKKQIQEKKYKHDARVVNLLRKRSIRSESWIVAVQVLTKPFWCPGKCIFCPTDATMPKSYVNTQPWAMRALLNQFDPYKQVYNRLLSLMLTGHKTDKIEMIVLWWTRDVYPKKYKTEFIKGLFDAANHFDEFLEQIEIDYTNPKAARYTWTDSIEIDYPKTIDESIKKNETATNRIIWLTVETRPEYVTDENCQFWRDVWITRMEMGIQTLHNSVHDINKRGHDNEAIIQAMHKLRQYGFKISNHYMPWLYWSTPAMDEETFRIAFDSIAIKSDELKFYPTAVIPNTPLYDLWKEWTYKPIADDDLKTIIKNVKKEIIPPYTRIKRLARDFDTSEVVAWANTPNLRQLTMNAMKETFANDPVKRKEQYQRLFPHSSTHSSIDTIIQAIDTADFPVEQAKNCEWWEYRASDRIYTLILDGAFDCEKQRWFVCLCTRCREMRHRDDAPNDPPFYLVRAYRSSNWIECFCSFEDADGYLYGFVRLMLPEPEQALDYPWLGKQTAVVRELHVYGTLQSLLKKTDSKNDTKPDSKNDTTSDDKTAQHGWYGKKLMRNAELIAQWLWYEKLSVISWIWVRQYYEKIWYDQEGTYMVKTLWNVEQIS